MCGCVLRGCVRRASPPAAQLSVCAAVRRDVFACSQCGSVHKKKSQTNDGVRPCIWLLLLLNQSALHDVATASSQRNTLGVNPCVRSPWLSLSCSLLPFKRSTFGQTLPRG